jgi:hypothetical protein
VVSGLLARILIVVEGPGWPALILCVTACGREEVGEGGGELREGGLGLDCESVLVVHTFLFGVACV